MILTIVIAAITCAGLVTCVLLKPEIGLKHWNLPLYPLVALLGAACIVAFTPLTVSDCLHGIAGGGAVNPVKILALFISVTAISVFLDEAGFFEYLAYKVLTKAASPFKLFILLYLTVSVLTVFTSNDVIILTFTPFLLYFCKNAGIRSTPFLVAEFAAANTWSMTLMIGNPTNVYLASAAGLDFLEYAGVMALPTLAAGLASFAVLLLLFRKSLKAPAAPPQQTTAAKIKDKPLCVIGLAVLAVCTVLLAISGYIHVEMWLECVICAGVLIVVSLLVCFARHKKPVILGHALLRVPYQLIPFVLGMFVIVLGLDRAGVTSLIAQALSAQELFLYGIVSFLSANFVNNIPMSVLFASVAEAGGAGQAAVYAAVVGSNLGALLTPVGALAGIMFSSMTKKAGEKFSNLTFIKYGLPVSAAGLAASLGVLALIL